MSIQSQFDREEAAIIEDMNSGAISREDGMRAIRELHRDYRGAAEEAARDAYEREMERW